MQHSPQLRGFKRNRLRLVSEMPSHMLSSVLEEPLQSLRAFVKLSWCGRRKHKLSSPTPKVAADKSRKGFVPKSNYDSDVTTQPGDFSSNEFSDHSYKFDGSISGSDLDAPMGCQVNAPVGLPPGLDAPPGLGYPHNQKGKRQPVPHLNKHAPSFVPSASTVASTIEAGLSEGLNGHRPNNSEHLRQSIKMLKGALEDWEQCMPAPDIVNQPSNFPPAAEGSSVAALQEALSRLTPAEAATVRNLLDSKAAMPTNGTGYNRFSTPPFLPSAHDMLSAAAFRNNHPGANPSPPWKKQSQSWDQLGQQRRTFSHSQAKTSQYGTYAKPQGLAQTESAEGAAEGSLSTHLRDLAQIDNSRVLMVRQINRLGLNSAAALEKHFEKFGKVEQVMVSHTRAKSKLGKAMRLRPACLGFVIMSNAEEVEAALACGSEHVVKGECIGVQDETIGVFNFVSHDIDEK